MYKKTSKLRKLEKNRYSIITEDLEHCIACGKSPVDMHEIYGGCNRIISMKNGFCMPLCRLHHRKITDFPELNDPFKKMFQEKYEETHTREDFIKLIGRNYLE